MEKTIQLTYSPDGSVVIEAEGFFETECLNATKAFELALKIETDRKMKKKGDEESGARKRTKLRN